MPTTGAPTRALTKHEYACVRSNDLPTDHGSSTQIVIKTITGREQKFDFEPSAKILDIKQKLQEQEGISSDQIRLVCGGKQLCVSRRALALGSLAGLTAPRAPSPGTTRTRSRA